MTHCVKALAVKCDDLSLVLETHMTEEENQLLQAVFWHLHVCHGMHFLCTQKEINIFL